MNFEFVRTPWWIRYSIPFATWKIRTANKSVFLTFDDSPSSITPYIIDCLGKYEAKATFFCIGQNIVDRPEEFQHIVSSGHAIGNHTMTHINGWNTPWKEYVNEYDQCQHVLKERTDREVNLFRPPFGRITFRQMLALRKVARIFMWDVLSLDYRTDMSPGQVTQNVVQNCQAGSIPLLHDSELAAARVKHALPEILKQLRDSGYTFESLKEN